MSLSVPISLCPRAFLNSSLIKENFLKELSISKFLSKIGSFFNAILTVLKTLPKKKLQVSIYCLLTNQIPSTQKLPRNKLLQISSLCYRWCSSDVLRSRLYSASSRSVVSYPLPVNHLIDLPDDYSQLINQISSFT